MLGSRQQQLRADSGREQASQPSRIDYQKTEAVREGRRHRGQLAIISLYLTSSAARDCMPPAEHNLGRGSTSHASRRWRRGGRALHSTPSSRCAPQRRRPLLSAAVSPPLEAHAAAPGVPERGGGVQASTGVHRGVPAQRRPTLKRRARSFTSTLKIPAPARSEWPRIRKKNHPRHREMDTTPVDVMTTAHGARKGDFRAATDPPPL